MYIYTHYMTIYIYICIVIRPGLESVCFNDDKGKHECWKQSLDYKDLVIVIVVVVVVVKTMVSVCHYYCLVLFCL